MGRAPARHNSKPVSAELRDDDGRRSWDSAKRAAQRVGSLQALSEGVSHEAYGWVQQPLYEAALRGHLAAAPRECTLTAHYG